MTGTAQKAGERGWQARFFTIWTGQTLSLLGSMWTFIPSVRNLEDGPPGQAAQQRA